MQEIITRRCGGCTACCWTHAVPSIAKEAETKCPHNITTGCARYTTRPHECSLFTCAWLHGEGDEDDRPDKNGLVLGAAEFLHTKGVLTIHETATGSYDKSDLARTWLGYGKESSIPTLLVRAQGHATLFMPNGFDISSDDMRLIEGDEIRVVQYEE